MNLSNRSFVYLLLYFFLFVSTSTLAQTKYHYSVGDKVNDLEISGVINYHKPALRFSDFKNKVIIIDFWGTTCVPCIAALPLLDSLQRKYKEKIQVITVTRLDTKEAVMKTLGRSATTRNLSFPIVVTDSLLSTYFRYDIVSHVIWIGADRKVKAITGSDYINDVNVNRIIKNEKIEWAIKEDFLEYDREAPLLDFNQKNLTRPAFHFYSGFTGYLQGIMPASGYRIDSVNNVAVVGFYNVGLLSLCKTAVDYKVGGFAKEFVLEIIDSTRFFPPSDVYPSEWRSKNTFCYSRTMPISLNPTEVRELVQKDLVMWLYSLGYSVAGEKRMIKGYALRYLSATNVADSTKPYLNTLYDSPERKLVNGPVSTLVDFLNRKSALPWVFDETGLSGSDRISVSLSLENINNSEELQSQLIRNGFMLLPVEREHRVIVVKEIKRSNHAFTSK